MAKSLGEQYLEKKEKLENSTEKSLKLIDNISDLKKEIEKYNNNEKSDFNNVVWSKIIKDKDFTEDLMTMFQVQAQNYYEDYVKSHKVSDEFLRKMYYEFLGHFNLSWLSDKDKKRVFPELD